MFVSVSWLTPYIFIYFEYAISNPKVIKSTDPMILPANSAGNKENTNPSLQTVKNEKPDKQPKEPKPKKTEKVPKTPKEPKLPKGTILESDIKKVYDYVKSQNRPYSVGDIFTNMRKAIGKTNLIRIMDQLESDGKGLFTKNNIFQYFLAFE